MGAEVSRPVIETDGTRAGTRVLGLADGVVQEVRVHPALARRREATVVLRDVDFVWTGAGEAPDGWEAPR